MLELRPTDIKETKPDFSKDAPTVGRNATIKLFPPSRLAMRYSFSFGCKATQVNTITLNTDVCLSGDYYLNHNMLISEAPICADGSIPTMSYYPARGCVGETQFESTLKPIPDYCLWGGVAPKYWSLIFRCGPDASSTQGADKHEVAIPPAAPKPLPYKGIVQPDGPYDGVIVSHTQCAKHRISRGWSGRRHVDVPVDQCIATTSQSLTVKKEAICTNGTRAQLARFETSNCNDGHLSSKYGLIDIHDTDIGADKCLSTDILGPTEKIRSIAFWCEGVKVESPESRIIVSAQPIAAPKKAEGKDLGAENLHVMPTHVQGLKVLGADLTTEKESSFGLAITVYAVASVVVLIGLWVWFGSLIPSLSRV